ncbi:MAG: Cytosine-specific methyltransferase [Parcubacteria group bacterium GW2011_GWA1_38_7]|nr:MAG: Cytosine-specific methyltransferase [Parcubacteria group bacterium GW2011_GWA1_38_7]
MIYNHITYPLSDLDMQMAIAVPQGGNWRDIPTHIPSKRLEQIRKSGGRTTLYGRLAWDKPSYTITTYFNRPGNGTYVHPEQNRVISAREAARLQSFPDNFLFSGSKGSLCIQIGNAVPPLLAFFLGKKIKNYTKTKNVVDLFCGAGGLSKGFERAGYNIVAANDNYKQACETYRANHPHTTLVEGDVTKKETKNALFDAIEGKKIDIIIGGPPCQGFSHAGKRLVDDPRNFLFKEFVEIVKKIKPKVVVLENVEGILTMNEGKSFESIKKSFRELDYKLDGKKLHAVKFGVPQKRKRVVMIGLLEGNPNECYPEEVFQDESKYLTVREAIDDLPEIIVNGGSHIIEEEIKPRSNYQKFLAGTITIEDFVKNLYQR